MPRSLREVILMNQIIPYNSTPLAETAHYALKLEFEFGIYVQFLKDLVVLSLHILFNAYFDQMLSLPLTVQINGMI